MLHTVKPGETLYQISRDYRMPLTTILAVNSIPNPDLIRIGQRITIPGYPPVETQPYQLDVSINERLLRLYKNGQFVKEYPVAVGRMLYETPIGDFIILNKAPDPGGPFGTMWMSLSKEHYGIHGTNNPSSIGKAVSRGCVRMYNEDVEELALTIPNGTPVTIHL
ncbi:L,D-transpeptidase family protein [Halobacillus sp. Cin3]|uniref:L,D-transpeptidase family protein n=1 Tax=Halobacillus sp. Cin3 TaxID=2928441 RepID=UPI00248E3360|nr:L,D-transpeptidase family protein [Halobacillus sp. Cin3]